jgi:hypothetical protein
VRRIGSSEHDVNVESAAVTPKGTQAMLAIRQRVCFAMVGGVAVFCLPGTNPTAAAPPDVTVAQQDGIPSADAENNGQDFTRPLSLFQLRYQYQTAPGSGSEKGTMRDVTTDTVTPRADQRFDLSPQWTLALRADLPTVAKNPISSGNPTGSYEYGIGDADLQATIVRSFDARWAAGIGARIIAPTGAPDLGSSKWQSLSGAGVRMMLPEISQGSYFVPQVRYDISFRGDPSKKNISNLQFMPTLNIALPDHWFFTFYPSADIRLNYGDTVTGQTGRLFLPFDFMIGRTLSRDVTISLEIGLPIVSDYPVYNFKTEARLNVKF